MFSVRVWDNFHYMDEDEAYIRGEYPTWDEAVAAARRLVDLSLAECYKPGMTAADLYSYYTSFGDDTSVVPEPKGHHFSAWGYARDRCEELCSGAGEKT